MSERSWKFCRIIALIGLLSGLIHWQYATGWLLGAAVAVLLYRRNETYWNDVVDTNRNVHRGTGMLHFLGNYALMAGVLVLGALFPQYLNIFASALGLMLIKLSVIAENVFPKKGEQTE